MPVSGQNFYQFKSFTSTTTNATGTYTNSEGAYPQTELIVSGDTLYGTTEFGGEGNSGTIFSLPLPTPPLAINLSGTNAILTWPAIDTGYTLESTPDLGASVV